MFHHNKERNLPSFGIIGCLLVTIAFIALYFMWQRDYAEEYAYSGPERPLCIVSLQEDGETYEVHAVEGQVIVIFNEDVSHKDAVKILKYCGGNIVAQFLTPHYYMIEVSAGEESNVVSLLSTFSEVAFVFPNAIESLCSANPYVIDYFKADDKGNTHGDMVSYMMTGNEYSAVDNKNFFDVRLENGNEGEVSFNKVDEALIAILDNLQDGESAVINMSFGIPLYDKKGNTKRVLWNDPLVNWYNHFCYKLNYPKKLESLVHLVMPYDEKDFVITKGVGNEGFKELDNLINATQNKLSPKELAVFKRHFVLVSAKDDNKERDYPNDITQGTFHEMFSKVDISDMTAQDLKWQGTSFSAPRMANYIITAANTYDMKVVDVLQQVREATKLAPDNTITYDMLETAIMNDSQETVIEENTNYDDEETAQTADAIVEGVLKMYLLNTDDDYGQEVSQYFETDYTNTYLAFVVKCDKVINVEPYLDEGDVEFLGSDNLYYSSFMLAKWHGFSARELASRYANRRVRVRGALSVPGGGWRNATNVVMDMKEIKLVDDIKPKETSQRGCGIPKSLVGTKWESPNTKTQIVEFVDQNHVIERKRTWFNECWEETYDCYYDSQKNQIVVNVRPGEYYFKYENGRLFSLFYTISEGFKISFEWVRKN